MNEANKAKEGMDVVCSCGKRIGKVDRLQGDMIKLAKNDPASDGEHHFVPTEWVARVDRNVVLNKNSQEVESEWMAESAA